METAVQPIKNDGLPLPLSLTVSKVHCLVRAFV